MLLDTHTAPTVCHFLELAKKVTLAEIMNPMLPEMYTVLYPIDQRDAALLSTPPETIFRATRLQDILMRETSSSSSNG